MKCNYTFNGTLFSYGGLIDEILKRKLDNPDILYSIEGSQLERAYQGLSELKSVNNVVKDLISEISESKDYSSGGDPVGKRDENKMHILQWIDDLRFRDDTGKQYIAQMSDSEFIENEANILKALDDNLTYEEAKAKAKEELPTWEQQRLDGFILHYILRLNNDDFNVTSLEKILNLLKSEHPELKNRIDAMLLNQSLLKDMVKMQLNLGIKTRVKGCKVITNIPIIKKINVEFGQVELYDSIDQVVIDENGYVKIFKYKIAEDYTGNWNNRSASTKPKVEKYRFELAFIKAILEESGYVSNAHRDKISLHLYTIQTEYDHEGRKDGEEIKLKSLNPEGNVIDMEVNGDGYSLMDRHLEVARKLILPTLRLESCSEAIRKANNHMNRVWFGKNIVSETTTKSVDDYIKSESGKSILKITSGPESKGQYHYKIRYPRHAPIYIKEATEIENNTEIRENVELLLAETQTSNDTVMTSLIRSISQAGVQGYMNWKDLQGLNGSSTNIIGMLSPYFTKKSDDNTPEWNFIKDNELADYGILMFQKNDSSKQIDFVVLTNLELKAKTLFKNGLHNLAGCFLSDIASQLPESDWGNITIMKTLILLNYIIPSLSNGKLGEIKVISSYKKGEGRTANIQHWITKYYNPLMNIVYLNTKSDGEFEYNFDKVEFVNSYKTLLDDLKGILNGSLRDIKNIDKKIKSIEEAELGTDATKIDLLMQLLKDISLQYSLDGRSDEDLANQIYYGRASKQLLILNKINEVINKLRNVEVDEPKKIGSIQKWGMTTSAIPSNNFKVVYRMWKLTSQAINDEAYDVGLEINRLVLDYYKACGYTYTLNKYIGNQASQFANLFDNINGNMRFKNPYDNEALLKDYERKFLKEALYIFARSRYTNHGMTLPFTDFNSLQAKDFIEKNEEWYFNVPLKKASDSTMLLTGYSWNHTAEQIKKMITDPKLWAREFLDDKAIEAYYKSHNAESDVTKLSVVNYFSYGETSISGESFNSGQREEVLGAHSDRRYFETNVENLLRDFTFEQIRTLNLKKLMLGSKLFLMQMRLSGLRNANLSKFNEEFDVIDKFLKVSVFNIPLMDSSQLAIAGFLLPVRRIVSKMFVAGNVAGGIRDTIEGFGQIMARAITKYGTDVSLTDVLKAYSIVTKDMMFNMRTASIVSLLCIKYRMSNIDVSNVAEGMKSGGRGIFNFLNEMYKTLRTPDFLNRMVLFVSKCLHDGTWNAFSLNDKGELTYNWKLDKRFSLLATDNKSNLSEYNKQKSLFYSSIDIWNLEHPNNKIEKFDTLPMPYTEKEMNSLHELSDNIWGSYDNATKPLGEHALIGMTFGMFTTWMSGQIKNYFQKLLESTDQFEWTLMKDNDGNLLYYNDDGSVTTENTGSKVMCLLPVWVQGIWQTLVQMYDTIKDGGSLENDVFNTRNNRDNMKKLLTDITMTLIYLALIRTVLNAMRKKQKEITDPHDVITNGICEVLYRGMYNAWDGFAGPLNVIQYLGDLVNPPVYSESIAVTKDLFKFVVGDMTILSFGSRHLAPIRSFKQTIKAAETGKQPA